MAPSPISPTNISPPVNVSGGTGNVTVSGLPPASGFIGASGSFAGPHCITEQWLSVNYFRAPNYSWNNVSPRDFSLSSTVPTSTVVSGSPIVTTVWGKVTANVRVRKSYDRFSTSAYQQPQKFTVLATSADANGNTYGAVTQGGLGPAGELQTSQKFYSRRAWLGTDTEIDHTTMGWTYNFGVSSVGTDRFPLTSYSNNQETVFGKFWLLDGETLDKFPELNRLMSWSRTYPFNANSVAGALYGPYLAANEQLSFSRDILDKVGNNIADGRHLYNWELAVAGKDYPKAMGCLFAFTRAEGGPISEYDVSRHDYS